MFLPENDRGADHSNSTPRSRNYDLSQEEYERAGKEDLMRMLDRKKTATAAMLLLFVFVPIVAKAQVAWVKDFSTALKQAAKEKKFIVLDISASW
jgi:hypothetical protein